MRTRFTRRFRGFRKAKPRLQWVREAFNQTTPGNPDNQDLLANYKNQFAIAANLPGMTIERIHLRLNVQMTESSTQADNGVFVSCWVDSQNQTILTQPARPYDQQFLIWDQLFIGEALMGGAVTPFYMNRVYDVRARRRIMNIFDTCWLQLSPQGTATLSQYAFIMSLLVRLH